MFMHNIQMYSKCILFYIVRCTNGNGNGNGTSGAKAKNQHIWSSGLRCSSEFGFRLLPLYFQTTDIIRCEILCYFMLVLLVFMCVFNVHGSIAYTISKYTYSYMKEMMNICASRRIFLVSIHIYTP